MGSLLTPTHRSLSNNNICFILIPSLTLFPQKFVFNNKPSVESIYNVFGLNASPDHIFLKLLDILYVSILKIFFKFSFSFIKLLLSNIGDLFNSTLSHKIS